MTTWASITPSGGPHEVEQARQRLDELRGRTGTERDRIEQSKRDLAACEQADRDKMAAAFTSGTEPTSDVKTIEKLRAAVGEAERRAAALDAAVAQADAALGQAVAKHRTKWQADAEQAIEQHRQQARNALAQLTDALNAIRSAAATAAWLRPEGGADEGRPPKAGLGSARSSARWAANGEQVNTDALLAWISEAIEPPPVQPAAPHLHATAEADAA